MNRSSIRRLLYLAAFLPFFFSNCKKSNSNSANSSGSNGYYMRFKMGGSSVEYGSQAFAEIAHLSSNNLYTCVMAAYKDVNAGAKNAVTITIFSADPIAAGVGYNDPLKAAGSGGNVPETTIFWYDATGAGYLTAGSLSDNTGNTRIAGVVANAKLTITELTSTYLKGTFSGTAYRSDFATSEVITEGEFYLKRTQ